MGLLLGTRLLGIQPDLGIESVIKSESIIRHSKVHKIITFIECEYPLVLLKVWRFNDLVQQCVLQVGHVKSMQNIFSKSLDQNIDDT